MNGLIGVLCLVLFSMAEPPEELKFTPSYEVQRTDSGSWVHCYYAVPYSSLTFQKDDSLFSGGARFYMGILKKGYPVAGNSETFEVTVPEESISSPTCRLLASFKEWIEEEGSYTLVMGVEDIVSGRKGEKRYRLKLRHLQDVDVREVVVDTTAREPIMRFVLRNTSQDSVRIKWVIMRSSLRILKGDTTVGGEEVAIGLGRLEGGQYTLNLSLYAQGKKKAVFTRDFSLPMDFFKNDSLYAIRLSQLRIYCSSPESLKELRNARTPEERKKAWEDFWARRDPIPQTMNNEALEEFLRRVDYANVHFSYFGNGWKTDRGRIYIRYGPPSEVESHPMERNSPPYEVWYYDEEGLVFIFMDRYGIGDYKLINPSGIWRW